MPGQFDPANFPLRMEGGFDDAFYLLGARVEEGINRLTEITLDFACTDREVDLEPLLGSEIKVTHQQEDKKRVFVGTCVSIEFVGTPTGAAHYRAVLRPELWFLGRTHENRVFQNMSAFDIIRKILTDYGLWGNVKNKTTATYGQREYTIQYRETDLDFIMRLAEEEGLYFFFLIEDESEKMVLADGPGGHEDNPDAAKVEFIPLDAAGQHRSDRVFDWHAGLDATSGKLTLFDYNFEKPRAKIQGTSSIPKGTHSNKDREIYGYPGRFRESDLGNQRARVRMEAEAARHKTARGAASEMNLLVGHNFKLENHGRVAENAKWMMTRATHLMRLSDSDALPQGIGDPIGPGMGYDELGQDAYRVQFEVVPAADPYRAPLVTPWPEIAGVHTARVTGPAGEEIHTDKYGRIKVKFHWDRDDVDDDKTSCFVRCMMPWTGKAWGMMAVPRIGQEVVVQFEEGNPDRPLVIGMLYNADTMPPWELPANMTQSGVKTRSTKEGNANTFNELMFEDKKGAELVRFQSERDYRQIVKNDAEITVGLEHKDKGDMKLTVHRHLTEELKTGDHAFTVTAGKQTIKVKKDVDETIEGKSTQTITDDVTRTVKMGNVSDTVEMGNVTETIKMGNVTRELNLGNEKTTLKIGNYDIKCNVGKITEEALTGIDLVCGASSIKMTPASIEIKAPMITIEAQALLQAKGLMTKVDGTTMVMIKGAITMIN